MATLGTPTLSQLAEGARLALANAADLLIVAKASSSPALSAALVTLTEEEIGKAFLIAEALSSDVSENSASWASCKRSFRDHRAKLMAYHRWTEILGLGPDPGLYCDTEDGVIPEHEPMPDAELADLGQQLKLECLYVDWNDEYDEWVYPLPLAGHSVTLGHLLDTIDSYSVALEVLLGAH
ncbi:MAG: AbiV family abortive infection protein [Coriobacteriia bacterium]